MNRSSSKPFDFQSSLDAIRADFNMANESRFRRSRRGVSGTGRSADWHIRNEAKYLKMIELARDFDRNDVVLGQGVDRVIDNVVQDGFTLDPQVIGADGKPDEQLNELLKNSWREWSEDESRCDVQGEGDFHELEEHALRATLVDGDIVPLPRTDGRLQMIEAHRVRTPVRTRRNVVLGWLLSANRRRDRVFISKDDIDPLGPSPKLRDMEELAVRDEAGHRQVFHVYRRKRVSQTRGVTAFAPIVDTAGMHDDLQFAKLVQAQIVSCFAILEELSDDYDGPPGGVQIGDQTSESVTSTFARILEGISPGLHVTGRPGSKLTGFSPDIPNQSHFEHTMLLLTFVAINLGVPLAVLLLDPSRTNFSGWRGAIEQARIGWRRLQRRLVQRFHRPVYRWKVRQWVARDTDLQTAMTSGIDIFAHRWISPEWRYIEPNKDIAADVTEDRTALNSKRRIHARRGRDWDEIYPEIIDDNAKAIQAAHERALQLNADFEGLNLHWRELLSLPLAEGLQIAVGGTNEHERPGNAV